MAQVAKVEVGVGDHGWLPSGLMICNQVRRWAKVGLFAIESILRRESYLSVQATTVFGS